MSTNNDKYLVLRGKNKDIFFIQKRVSKKIASLIGKDFIKKSLETTNIYEAREKRDEIIDELNKIEKIGIKQNVPIKYELLGITKNIDEIQHNAGNSYTEIYGYKNRSIEDNSLAQSNKYNKNINNAYENSDDIDIKNKNVPTNKLDPEIEVKENQVKLDNEDNKEIVLIESEKATKNKDGGYFSFINYSKLPKKEDYMDFFDKIIPVFIIFLFIFVTMLVS